MLGHESGILGNNRYTTPYDAPRFCDQMRIWARVPTAGVARAASEGYTQDNRLKVPGIPEPSQRVSQAMHNAYVIPAAEQNPHSLISGIRHSPNELCVAFPEPLPLTPGQFVLSIKPSERAHFNLERGFFWWYMYQFLERPESVGAAIRSYAKIHGMALVVDDHCRITAYFHLYGLTFRRPNGVCAEWTGSHPLMELLTVPCGQLAFAPTAP